MHLDNVCQGVVCLLMFVFLVRFIVCIQLRATHPHEERYFTNFIITYILKMKSLHAIPYATVQQEEKNIQAGQQANRG